jgi:hypothetical protein
MMKNQRIILTAVVVLAAAGMLGNAWGAVRTWLPNSPSNWNTPANWSGSVLPTSIDTASFDVNDGNCTLDVSPFVAGIQFTGSYMGTFFFNNKKLSVSALADFRYMPASTANILIGGNDTLVINGSSVTMRIYAPPSRDTLPFFYAAPVSFPINLMGGSDTLIVAGFSMNGSGSFSASSGQRVEVLSNVSISGGTVSINATASMDVKGDLTINSGFLNAPNFGILSISGSFTKTSGTFVHNSGTVMYNAGAVGGGTINCDAPFYNLTFNSTGDKTWTVTGAGIHINNTLTIQSGTLNLGAGTVDSCGAFIATGGTLNFGSSILKVAGSSVDFSAIGSIVPGTGKLEFCHSVVQAFIPKVGVTFPEIVQNGMVSTSLSNRLDAAGITVLKGTFILNTSRTGGNIGFICGSVGSLDFNNDSINVSDIVDLSALAVNPGTGILRFVNNTPKTFVPKNGGPNPRLIKAGTGTTTIGANYLVGPRLELKSGTFALGPGGIFAHQVDTLRISGGSLDFQTCTLSVKCDTIDFQPLAVLTPGTGTLRFMGINPQVFIPKSSSSVNPVIWHTGTGLLKLSTYTLTANGFIHQAYAGPFDFNGQNIDIVNSGNLIINHSPNPPTITGLGGRTITIAGKGKLTGEAGYDLLLNPGTAWTISTGDSLVADFVNLANCNAGNKPGIATNSVNGANNANWTFVKQWTGGGDMNWGTASNWSPASLPTDQDSLVFTGSGTCYVNIPRDTVKAITFSGYAGSFYFMSDTLTVLTHADFRGTTGSVDSGYGALKFIGSGASTLKGPRGYPRVLPTIFRQGTGTVTVLDTIKAKSIIVSGGVFDFGTSGAQDTVYHELAINGGTVNLGTNNAIEVQALSGTGTLQSGIDTLIIAGNADFSGLSTFTPGTGTVVIRSENMKRSIFSPGTKTFNNLVLWNKGVATSFDTIEVGGGNFTVGGNLVFRHNKGSTTNTSVWRFDGGGNPAVTINGNVSLEEMAGSIPASPSLFMGTGTWTFKKNVFLPIGAGTGQYSTIVFSGTTTQACSTWMVSPADSLGIIQHTSNGTLRLAGFLRCRSFYQTAGTLDFSLYNMATSGDFTVTNGTGGSFSNLDGRTLTIGGNASISGTSASLVNLDAGTYYYFTMNAGKTLNADWAKIRYSQVSGITGVATNSRSMGYNSGWNISGMNLAWTGSSNSSWKTAANWSPAIAPADSDNVVFNSGAVTCLLDTSTGVKDITFASGYSGTFDFSTNMLTVSGNADFSNIGGILNTSGTLKFYKQVPGKQYFTPKAGATFPSIYQSGMGGGSDTVTLTGNPLTAGRYYKQYGTLQWGDYAATHNVQSLINDMSGEINFGNSTVRVNDSLRISSTVTSSAGAIIDLVKTSGTQTVGIWAIDTLPAIRHSGAGTVQLDNSLRCKSYEQTAGVFNTNGYNLSAAGDITMTGGTSSISDLASRKLYAGGSMTLNGLPGDSIVISSSAVPCTLAVAAGRLQTSKAIVSKCIASIQPGYAVASRDAGTNLNWTFYPADTKIWAASGVSGKWNTAANWMPSGVPTASDSVVFNTTSVKSCTLDVTGFSKSIAFTSGYTGTFEFTTNTLNVNGVADFTNLGNVAAGSGAIAFVGSAAQALIPHANDTLPAIVHSGNATLQISINALTCMSFVQSGGPLVLNSTDIVTINDFTVTNGTSTLFSGLDNRMIHAGGNVSLAGQNGNLLNLNPASLMNLSAAGTLSIAYAVIAQCNASASAHWPVLSNCTDAGGNSRFDFTMPAATIASPENGRFLNSLTSISGTARDTVSGISQVQISLKRLADNQYWNGASWNTPLTMLSAAGTTAWSYATGGISFNDGGYVITALATDSASNTGAMAVDSFTMETTVPSVPGISIVNNTGFTNSGTVQLALSAAGADSMRFHLNAGGWMPWEANAASKSFTIAGGGEGMKRIYAMYEDKAGNTTSIVSDSIMYDTTSPQSPSISISDNNGFSATATPQLALAAVGADSMHFQLNAGTWSAWESYSAAKNNFDISSGGDGTKVVAVAYKDKAGNAGAMVSDSTVYDSRLPAITTVSVLDSNGYINTGRPKVQVVAVNADSIRIALAADTASALWKAYSTLDSIDLSAGGEGVKGIFVQVKTLAYVRSVWVSDSTVYDATPPQSPSIAIADNNGYTGSPTPQITLAATGADSMHFQLNAGTWSAWESYAATKNNFDITSGGNGTKVVAVAFKDKAGNTTSAVRDSTIYDSRLPAVTRVTILDSNGYINTGRPHVQIAAVNADSMRIALAADTSAALWKTFVVLDSIDVSAGGEGTKKVFVQVTTLAGVRSAWVSDSTVYDATPPQSPAIAIVDNNGYTAQSMPQISLSAVGADSMQCEVNAQAWTAWEPYATAKSNLDISSGGDGIKRIFARFKDRAGNISATVHDSTVYDTRLPVMANVAIVDSNGYINTRMANIKIMAANADSMRLALSTDTSIALWKKYAAQDSFDISSGSVGFRRVWVQVKTVSGVRSAWMADSTVWDTTMPRALVSTKGGFVASTWPGVISGTASDMGSGIKSIYLSIRSKNDTTFWNGSAWIPSFAELQIGRLASWTYSMPCPKAGMYQVLCRAVDSAGNVQVPSDTAVITILKDTLPPAPVTILHATPTVVSTVVLSWDRSTSSDAESLMVCTSVKIPVSGRTQGKWGTMLSASRMSDTLVNLPADGSWLYVNVYVRDTLGNWSLPAVDSVMLGDTVPPVNNCSVTLASVGDTALRVSWTVDTTLIGDAGFVLFGYAPFALVPAAMPYPYRDTSFVVGNIKTPGLWRVSTSVADAAGNRSPVRFDTITILPLNTLPVLSSWSLPDSVMQDSTATGRLMVTDADAFDSISITWSAKPSWITVVPQGRTAAVYSFIFAGRPGVADIGWNRLTFSVLDRSGPASGPAFMVYDSIFVKAKPPAAPQVVIRKDQTKIFGAAARFVLGTQNPMDTGVTFEVSVRALDDTAYAKKLTSTSGVIDLFPLSDGRYSLIATVVDRQGRRDTLGARDTFEIKGATTRRFAKSLDTTITPWQMVSFPGRSMPASASGIFNTLFHWDEQAGERDIYGYYRRVSELGQVVPGAGYWRMAKDTGTVAIPRAGVLDTVVTITLYKGAMGWNQIASPFTYPVQWPYKGILWQWDDSTHDFKEADGVLYPWQGYWVMTDSTMTVRLENRPLFTPSGLAKRNIAAFADKNNWQVRMMLSGATNSDKENVLGFCTDAKNGYDASDAAEPPRMSDYQYVFFPHPEWKRGCTEYARDIRRTLSRVEAFTIGIAPGKGRQGSRIGFEGVAALWPAVQFYFADEKDIVPVEPGKSYAVGTSNKVVYKTLFVTTDKNFLKTFPRSFNLGLPYPNPTRRMANIRYSLPYHFGETGVAATEPYKVSIALYDVMGRSVRQLVYSMKEPGNYVTAWDGKNNAGRYVAAGMYFCKLNAGRFESVKRLSVIR